MKQDIDLYRSYKIMRNKHVATANNSRPLAGAVAGVIVTVAIAIAALLTMYVFLIEFDIDISTLSSEIASPTLKEQVQKADDVKTEAQLKNKVIQSLGGVDNVITSYQQLTNVEFQKVYSALPADTSIKAFAYAGSGKIMLTCSTKSKNAPSQYAENLNGLGITAAVGYTGFSDNGDYVSFTIECIVNAQEGGGK